MKSRKSGFTLMEIMVVIIVIAVLASVAGPMIGSITDQGRASATKSKMSSLKSALLSFKSDVGRLPYVGDSSNAYCADAYNGADLDFLADNEENNVLINECTGVNAGGYFQAVGNYEKKWKGPYMESMPGDFMVDAWMTKLKYYGHKETKGIYVQSGGPDSTVEEGAAEVNDVIRGDCEDIDDFAQSVGKVRKFN